MYFINLYCASCEIRCTFYIRFPFESTAANSETLVKTYTYDGRLGAGNSSNDLSTDSALLTQSTARASSIKTEASRSNGSARSGTSRVAFFVEDEQGYANTLTHEEESSYRNYLDIKQYLLKDLADFIEQKVEERVVEELEKRSEVPYEIYVAGHTYTLSDTVDNWQRKSMPYTFSGSVYSSYGGLCSTTDVLY